MRNIITIVNKIGLLTIPLSLVKFFYYQFIYGKKILIGGNTKIIGVKNISSSDILQIGVNSVGFNQKSDHTILSIKGILNVGFKVSINKGCKIEVGKNAEITIGNNTYINSLSKLTIFHKLSIGSNCAIAWNCQILDNDFHKLIYENKTDKNPAITISDNVWIACNCTIYKGSYIAKGCVISAETVIRDRFEKENCLIGGNPARIIKENITWTL